MLISFTPKHFKVGVSYYAELLLNNNVVATFTNLVQNVQLTYNVTVPGTYVVNVYEQGNGVCKDSETIQALFPLVQYSTTEVDCDFNTYTFNLILTNPDTAGSNVQYGWSFSNNCSGVNNWSVSPNLILSSDDIIRYIFVKNSNMQCCTLIASSTKSPCTACNLSISNVVFSCNG